MAGAAPQKLIPRRPRTAGAALLAAALLGGCGGSPSAEPGQTEVSPSAQYEELTQELEGLRGAERERRLVELAEREDGELNVYTSLGDPRPLEEAFEREYGFEVSAFRAESEEVAQRVSEEASAGRAGADVVETGSPELVVLADQGILEPYEPATAGHLVPGSVQDGWVADRFNVFAVSWNTKLVPRGEQPRSWEDLADPEWDGNLALEASDVEWYKTLYEYWTEDAGKSPEEADRLFEEITSDARVFSGHSLLGELLSAGEFEVAASNYVYNIETVIDKGAPVAWEPAVEPVISRPNGVAVVRDAAHPATATLFADWILSDGQEYLVDLHYEPARKDLATAPGVEEIHVDVEDFVANEEEWTERYDQLLRLGEAAPAE